MPDAREPVSTREGERSARSAEAGGSGCVLCGGGRFRSVYAPAAPGRSLERCRACSLLQMRPMPTGAELADFYQTYDVVGECGAYYQESWGPGALETPEGRDVADRADWMLRRLPAGARVLDVGSGPGLFLRLMKKRGVLAEGVELSGPAAQRSARDYALRVHNGTIADLSPDAYGAITLWDVIEHVQDPAALVREAARRLPAGGWLFLETPDEGALLDRAVLLLARLRFDGPAKTFYGLHHVVLFRPATMRRLLEENGFRVREVRGAETHIGRAFREKTLRHHVMRAGLRALFAVATLTGSRNKMLVAAQRTPSA